jgi:hypothetical protein
MERCLKSLCGTIVLKHYSSLTLNGGNLLHYFNPRILVLKYCGNLLPFLLYYYCIFYNTEEIEFGTSLAVHCWQKSCMDKQV